MTSKKWKIILLVAFVSVVLMISSVNAALNTLIEEKSGTTLIWSTPVTGEQLKDTGQYQLLADNVNIQPYSDLRINVKNGGSTQIGVYLSQEQSNSDMTPLAIFYVNPGDAWVTQEYPTPGTTLRVYVIPFSGPSSDNVWIQLFGS